MVLFPPMSLIKSSPEPPKMESFPIEVSIVSLPSFAIIVSLPPLPTILSALLPAVIESFQRVPTIVSAVVGLPFIIIVPSAIASLNVFVSSPCLNR